MVSRPIGTMVAKSVVCDRYIAAGENAIVRGDYTEAVTMLAVAAHKSREMGACDQPHFEKCRKLLSQAAYELSCKGEIRGDYTQVVLVMERYAKIAVLEIVDNLIGVGKGLEEKNMYRAAESVYLYILKRFFTELQAISECDIRLLHQKVFECRSQESPMCGWSTGKPSIG